MNNLKKLKKKYEELGKEIERLENEKKNKRWKADLDNINTYYELMDLAEELNKGEEINWGNMYQEKYCIYYDAITKTLCDAIYKRFKAIGQIYCLNENFLEIALERIGKERLEKLFKEE